MFTRIDYDKLIEEYQSMDPHQGTVKDAEELNVSPTTLTRILKRYGIPLVKVKMGRRYDKNKELSNKTLFNNLNRELADSIKSRLRSRMVG